MLANKESDVSNLYPAQFEEVFEVIEDSRNREVSIPNGFVVTFRDVPEANTFGETFIEALDMAQECLSLVLFGYREDGKPCPKPSAAIHGDVMIDINSEVSDD